MTTQNKHIKMTIKTKFCKRYNFSEQITCKLFINSVLVFNTLVVPVQTFIVHFKLRFK